MGLPDLVEVQTKSFEWFKEFGISEVFNDIYPISNFGKTLSLEFVGFYFDKPKYSIEECKERDFTYAAPIRAKLRLVFTQKGEIKEQDVYLGDFPLMTEVGTFVINGAERVIVSQLVRSPGTYYSFSTDKSGKKILESNIIPSRGTWLEFETDIKDIINVRIDRARKIPATVILRAFGLESNEEIISLFGEHDFLLNTLEKDNTMTIESALSEIYTKLRPGEPLTLEGAKSLMISKFFDAKRYDLTKTGRFKFSKKLDVSQRLEGCKLAEHIVSIDGEIVAEKGTVVTKSMLPEIKQALFEGAHIKQIKVNNELEEYANIQVVKVYSEDQKREINIIGVDTRCDSKIITIPDVYAAFSYFMNLLEGIGKTDDIDHLGNRRIKSVGELIQNQFRIGLSRMERVVKERMSISDIESISPQSLTNIRPLTASIKEFFSSSQLSQFMDQTNPLAELTNKRRLSALGPGGLTRDHAGFEVRDVHFSHYGRMCPIETPEGPNIGLINSLSTYAKINDYGFIETPYRKVVDNVVTDEFRYLTADDEFDFVIAQSNIELNTDGSIVHDRVIARHHGETIMVSKENVDFVDVSPKQIVSVATACIPFLENDDANRALMGANMQRQAIPLIKPQAPIIGTGMEYQAAKDSGAAVVSDIEGTVTYVDTRTIVVTNKLEERRYNLQKFKISNQGTCFNQVPIVKLNDSIYKGQILADGPSMDKGELALGQNVVVAFMTWNGYNYEDAIVMSERLVKEDVYTSIHIEEYEIESRDTKLGPEEITRDIPNVSEEARRYLDEEGIITIGSEVKEGDILVGKVTPKGQAELSAEEKLLLAIFGDKSREVRDNSLRVSHGGAGIIHDVKKFSRKNGDELPPGVNEVVRVYIVQKRKISEGDKMAGRHGNKGVISKILPIEDMPYLPDGTPVDIMLNPLGVPSRMNIGQILELHLGMAAKYLNIHIATPVFDGVQEEDLHSVIKESGMASDGKTVLYDGKTGEPFDERVSVGVMYMIKLAHMVDDKLHARSVGPYSLVTQQPLGGKAQNGGQRFGEMEVWALEAYGAAHTLQEILTVKSDDVVGRVKTYEAIVKGNVITKPGIPESFKVLQKELQALSIDVKMLDRDNNEIDLKQVEEEEEKDIRFTKHDDFEYNETHSFTEESLEDYDLSEVDEFEE